MRFPDLLEDHLSPERHEPMWTRGGCAPSQECGQIIKSSGDTRSQELLSDCRSGQRQWIRGPCVERPRAPVEKGQKMSSAREMSIVLFLSPVSPQSM